MNATRWLQGMAASFVLALLTGILISAAGTLETEIGKLIRQLGDDDFEKRETAGKRLLVIGEPALSALEQARKSDDAEVRRRATELVDAIWQKEYREIACFRGHTEAITSTILSPDGKRIATVSRDKTLRLWNVATGQAERILEGHTDWVFGLAFSPDGKQVVSGGEDGQLRFWDVETGKELIHVLTEKGSVQKLIWMSDGRLLSAGSTSSGIRFWDSKTGKEQYRSNSSDSYPVYAVAVSADNNSVVATRHGCFTVYSLGRSQLERRFQVDMRLPRCVAFSPDGKRLLCGCDFRMHLWDVQTEKELRSVEVGNCSVWAVAISPDGRRALCGAGKDVCLWDLETGRLIHRHEGHTDSVYTVAFFHGGRRAISSSEDKTVRIWSLPN